jgi:hypothetical protein
MPKGANAFWKAELPRDYRKTLNRGIVDVGVADSERAKQGLRALPEVCVVTETPVMRLVKNTQTGKREEVHTWSRLSVIGKTESDRALRQLLVTALKRSGIEAWLEG